MKNYKYIFLATAFILCNICSFAQDLVILHTNDSHSQIMPQTSGKEKNLGGYERREAYIKEAKKEYPNLLLLDAGDFSQGTPYFTLFKGDAEIELMNALGYQAAVVGNHELDNGQEELARRIKNANFPILCANYEFDEDSPLNGLLEPYTILEVNDKKIGVIGITLNLKGYVSPKLIEGMHYKQPYKLMNNLALKLKNEEQCDMVILLTHVGYDRGHEQNPSDDMLAANSENIDLIIGGHSHTHIEKPNVVKNKLGKDVTIVQAGSKGKIGRASCRERVLRLV